MKIEYILTVLIILILHSCKSTDKNIFEFDPRNIKGKVFTLSEIADNITYVPLDNVFPLSRISKIVINKDAIYLNSPDYGILRYTKTGEFINKVGRIGRGPGEYLLSMHFSVDDRTGNVYNISNRDELIQVYSKNGQYLRSIVLKEYGISISNILVYNSQIFIQCPNEYKETDYEWIIYDTLGNVIKKQVRHLPKFDCNTGGIGIPSVFENRILYYNSWADTIYTISSDYIEKPTIVLPGGDHRLPRGYIPIEQIFQKKYFSISKIFETEQFYIIRYYYKKYSIAFIKKHNSEALLNYFNWDESIGGHPISGIINDIDNGVWFLPDFYYYENGNEYLIGIQYPYHIISHIATEEFKNSNPKYPAKKKEFEKLAASLQETDNPVLMLVRLKK